jgi:hypothetical protein
VSGEWSLLKVTEPPGLHRVLDGPSEREYIPSAYCFRAPSVAVWPKALALAVFGRLNARVAALNTTRTINVCV